MASDNHASYAKIGFVVFAGIIAIAAALVYIAGLGDQNQEVMAESYFDTSVSGLSVGSSVDFRGVKIGEVRAINFAAFLYHNHDVDDANRQRVVVTMAISRKKFKETDGYTAEMILKDYVDHGLHATIASSGITGLSHIELQIPDTPIEDKPVTWRSRHILIPPAPSMMDSLSSAATRLMNQMSEMDFVAAWSNLAACAENAASLTKKVDVLLESQSSSVGAAIGNIEELTASVKELSRKLEENPSLLLRSQDPDPLPETWSR